MNLDVHHEPPRPGEVVRNYADISKARRLLGWEPTFSLEQGLHQTVQWFLKEYGKAR